MLTVLGSARGMSARFAVGTSDFFGRSDEDRSELFTGLRIWGAGEAYRQHLQRYPVVFLTFKDVRFRGFEECAAGFQSVISDAYHEHRATLAAAALSRRDQAYIERPSGAGCRVHPRRRPCDG